MLHQIASYKSEIISQPLSLYSGDWQTVEIPLNQMEPTYRGNKLDKPNFNADKIQEIRFFIGNGKAENFRLEIDKLELQ